MPTISKQDSPQVQHRHHIYRWIARLLLLVGFLLMGIAFLTIGVARQNRVTLLIGLILFVFAIWLGCRTLTQPWRERSYRVAERLLRRWAVYWLEGHRVKNKPGWKESRALIQDRVDEMEAAGVGQRTLLALATTLNNYAMYASQEPDGWRADYDTAVKLAKHPIIHHQLAVTTRDNH